MALSLLSRSQLAGLVLCTGVGVMRVVSDSAKGVGYEEGKDNHLVIPHVHASLCVRILPGGPTGAGCKGRGGRPAASRSAV